MKHSTSTVKHTVIERRSIDYVPDNERFGSAMGQFTLWLGVNLNITAIVTGALAVVLGGDVFWSLIGLFIGQILGSIIMGLQAIQGPATGLPQMIRSRMQFGVYGAVIPLLLVSFLYIGFSAGGTLLAGQAVAKILNAAEWQGIVLFGVITILVATLGYRAIHSLARIASVVGIIAFIYMFVALLAGHNISSLLEQRKFIPNQFILSISLAAAWQIAYGPYVGDYSRYLPTDTSKLKVFFAAASGTTLGSQAAMTFGVFSAAIAGVAFTGHEVEFVVNLGASGLVASLLYFVVGFGKITMMTLNAYSSYMSSATLVNGFREKATVSVGHRFIYVSAMILLAVSIALWGSGSFIHAFSSFLLFLLTFISPWSAICLADWQWGHRSKCDLQALNDPQGIYGRWNWSVISIYFIGLLMELPFVSSSIYTGPIAGLLDGADISWLVGLIGTGIVYYIYSRILPPASMKIQATD